MLADTAENLSAALAKLRNPKTYRQMLEHMKEVLSDESGFVDFFRPFRNLGKLRSALAKADTAEDAIRCCEEIFEEEIFEEVLAAYKNADVRVVSNYLKNAISAAEKAGRRLNGNEMDYIVWSCEEGIAPENFLADVFLDRTTRASGEIGGKPRGEYDPRTTPAYEGQNYAADVLAAEGYDVEMLKVVEGGNGYGLTPKSNPDFLVENRVFDAYTLEERVKFNTIKKEMWNKTKHQSDRIVLVLKDYKEDPVALKEFLLSQTKRDCNLKHLRELKAIVNGKVETWFVR